MIKKSVFFLFLALIALSSSCCEDNTVSVSGNAQVKVKPDIATITVKVEDTQATTSVALSNVNGKIAQVVAILQKNKISTKDYSTSSFNIISQYDYSNGGRVLTGQTASQSLSVTIRALDADGTLIGTLVRAFSLIKGVSINGVVFDQSDKTLGVKQARQAAFESAKKKADEYSTLSGQRTRAVLRIQAVNGGNIIPFSTDADVFKTSQALNTLVPVRDVTIQASVNIIFSLLP